MPLSSNTITGVNAVQTYTIGFGVITADTLTVTVDAVAYNLGTDWTLNAAKTQITFTNPTFTGGEVIYLERTSPIADADRPVDYTAGAVLTEEDLDNANLHLLHLIQESADDTAEALQIGSDATNWDAENKRILNLGAPVLASDAARLQDVQDAAIAAGQLPAVTGSDDDSILAVASGAWAVTAPSAARTALGLGTAAVLDSGTGVGDVVTVQAGGELPALLGTNLDLSGNTTVPNSANPWLIPTVTLFFNTLSVVSDTTGTAFPTSSTYDAPVIGQVFAGDSASFVSAAVGNQVTLQPGVYRLTFGFTAISNTSTGTIPARNPQIAGGLYIGDTGTLFNNRMFWSMVIPNKYDIAGELNAPTVSWHRTALRTVTAGGGPLNLKVKMANVDPNGLNSEIQLDSSYNSGFLMIEVLQDL